MPAGLRNSASLSHRNALAPLARQHPVRTAPRSLGWRVVPEQVGIAFDHLDEFREIIDAVAREGRGCFFTWAVDDEASNGRERPN